MLNLECLIWGSRINPKVSEKVIKLLLPRQNRFFFIIVRCNGNCQFSLLAAYTNGAVPISISADSLEDCLL